MQWWQAVSDASTSGVVPDVADLTHDSRRAGPGVAFAALPGRRTDGHDYLEAALAAGAPALVVQTDRAPKWQPFVGRVPIVVVPDTRVALAPLAASVHGDPSQKLRIVGVTGTDGKTTSSHLIAHVLDVCGLECGYLTSVGFETGAGFEPNATHMTTLEATDVQSLLARAVAAGRKTMVVEASSEGLALHRLDACEFNVAVFTNLTRDHLDFHGTMEAYLAAKGRLFEKLDAPTSKSYARAAIVNADDASASYLRGITRARHVSYGRGPSADLPSDFVSHDIRDDADGQRFRIEALGRAVAAYVPLIGRFNVDNSLAAVAVAVSQDVALEDAVEALASFPGVPGRLERIECGQPFRVYVDIASTPAALEGVLVALRPATKGLIWVVFGAAGGRDPARRGGMGRVAGLGADRCVLTSEDPRDEDPDDIMETIAAALRETGRIEGRDFVREPDRVEAIRYAFAHAGPDDAVLLAGKATETTMVVRGESIPWDERATARRLLSGG